VHYFLKKEIIGQSNNKMRNSLKISRSFYIEAIEDITLEAIENITLNSMMTKSFVC